MVKKITILLLLLVAGSTAYAQKYIGGGIAFGSEIETIGIGITGEYFVTEQISVAPSLIYFAPRNIGNDLNLRQTDLNINGNYHFATETGLDFYGQAGFNFAVITVPTFNIFTGERSNNSRTEVGLNIGGGFNYAWKDNLLPFAEARLTLGGYDQLVLMGGIKLVLN